ncbi:SCP2 sterol-binding domain-containing protein (plasmid) [Paracoccus versutus]|uniref:SCP-2 sterol transfer family protein n=1 Tax=Paracoccus versutus TaxID=34007 RepID=A0A099FPL2_PARVE|nr:MULTISPECIES: SCP2 sterol-binding domain-containing protein [Paracoccus]WGR63044.1 SCP2 sterol-binding domain-containing protein [Paracoccus ferrooxidans]SFX04503.1 SCP-2 sterol transfer family protein [Paracoccus pantotrophus]KGJ12509.1 sterol carrier family protein [Paracoccus versutus]MBT0780914.1 SCP2 sterol-binding domain-containing protein [Paracoccus sp. pheM1]MCJ1899558.1 SCP2 sterol-binding domain-containing protein [Paracoccus versutus]
MSKVIEAAVAALDEKAKGFDGTAKFVIEGEGAVYIDADGARAADDEAEVTLTASRETFEGLLSGDVNPTTAFMTGKLRVDGSMGTAMKLGALLS